MTDKAMFLAAVVVGAVALSLLVTGPLLLRQRRMRQSIRSLNEAVREKQRLVEGQKDLIDEQTEVITDLTVRLQEAGVRVRPGKKSEHNAR